MSKDSISVRNLLELLGKEINTRKQMGLDITNVVLNTKNVSLGCLVRQNKTQIFIHDNVKWGHALNFNGLDPMKYEFIVSDFADIREMYGVITVYHSVGRITPFGDIIIKFVNMDQPRYPQISMYSNIMVCAIADYDLKIRVKDISDEKYGKTFDLVANEPLMVIRYCFNDWDWRTYSSKAYMNKVFNPSTGTCKAVYCPCKERVREAFRNCNLGNDTIEGPFYDNCC